MLNDRQQIILEITEENGEVSYRDLCAEFPDVSEMTLRRDIQLLEKEGFVLRTRGGAVSLKTLSEQIAIPGEENEYGLRAHENVNAKKTIAEKALPFVKKGCSIYLDAGSTIMALAKLLPNERFTIITNATNIAQELVGKNNIQVIMLGGTLNRNTLSVSGPTAVQTIGKINIEMAFMSSSAFTLDSGFTVSNVYEAELKQKVISKAKKSIMLMDTSKIGKDLMFTLANIDDISVLVTEADSLPVDIVKKANEANIELI